LYKEQGNTNEAIQQYEKVITAPRGEDRNERPKQDARRNLTRLYRETNDQKKLLVLHENLVKDYPEEPCAKTVLAQYKVLLTTDIESAISLVEDSARSGCTNKGLVNRAKSMAYLAKWATSETSDQEAEKIYNQAIAIYADIPALITTFSKQNNTFYIVKRLQDSGVDIDAPDSNGLSALASQITNEELVSVKNLIELGADVNKPLNEDGVTPLMLAVSLRNKYAVALLLSSGADPKARTESGMTAEALAESLGLEEIVNMLNRTSKI
jgi:tetratricopeptide (TPR) repeat protein